MPCFVDRSPEVTRRWETCVQSQERGCSMQSWKRIILAGALAACAVGAVLLSSLSSAAAGGAAGEGAVTYTQVFHDASESFPFANPCTGAPGTATITFNAVMHVTVLTLGP